MRSSFNLVKNQAQQQARTAAMLRTTKATAVRSQSASSMAQPRFFNQQQQQESNQAKFNSVYMMAPVLLGMYAYQKQQNECEEVSRGDKIRGAYENKIRFFSPPEKMYEVFATQKTEEGEAAMTYDDFYRANTPYNYTELKSPEDYMEKYKPKLMEIVDCDKNGLISFTEFFFFLTLLQINPRTLRKAFKPYEKKRMTKEELSKELTILRKQTYAGKKQTDSIKLDARLVKANNEDFLDTNKHLCEQLFQAKEFITFEDLMDLRDEFKQSLWHYEFHCYDFDEETNTISLESFLKSITVCLPGDRINKYFRQIKTLKDRYPEDFEKRITLDEFIVFQHFLDNMEELKSRIYKLRCIDYEVFEVVIKNYSNYNHYAKEKKVKISDIQIKALFLLLDLDGSGELEYEEIIGVLNERKALGQSREAEAKQQVNKSIQQLRKWLREEIGIPV